MEPVTSAAIRQFIQRLAERYGEAGTLYLWAAVRSACWEASGKARCRLHVRGCPEATPRFRATLAEVAAELQLDLEDVPIAEFVPLPPEAAERRRALGRYGRLEVYIFDPYPIPLTKSHAGLRQISKTWCSCSAQA